MNQESLPPQGSNRLFGFVQKVYESGQEPDVTPVVAPSLKRILAFTLDYSVIALLLSPLSALFLPLGWDAMPMTQLLTYLGPVYLVGAVLFLFKDHLQGKSIGKRFFNLYVAKLEEGFPLARGTQLFARNLWLLILPVEALKMIFDPYCRRFGDRYSGTVVIELQRPLAVRRVTLKMLSAILVISVLWSAYIYLTPLRIRKSTGYQVALDAARQSQELAQALGNGASEGYWMDLSLDGDKEIYVLRFHQGDAEARIQVVLTRTPAGQPQVGNLLLLPPTAP